MTILHYTILYYLYYTVLYCTVLYIRSSDITELGTSLKLPPGDLQKQNWQAVKLIYMILHEMLAYWFVSSRKGYPLTRARPKIVYPPTKETPSRRKASAVYCKVNTVCNVVYLRTVYCVLYADCILCTVYCILYAVNCVLCTVYRTQSKPSALTPHCTLPPLHTATRQRWGKSCFL